MAKLKFKNPKTGLWEEAGGTTYTAGTGINISSDNVISVTDGGGGGDVTAAGNNIFTGTNEFNGIVTFHRNVTIGDEAGNATLDMYSNRII